MTALPTIPPHLPAWQAPHLAWLASQHLPTRYAVPKGTVAMKAELHGADLYRADLRGANLYRADLREADLREADMSGADMSEALMSKANLRGANLRGANLRHVVLTSADLSGANLRGAMLHFAVLSGADLSEVSGIASIGPIGRKRRLLYAVAHDDGPRIQDGYWWGAVDGMIARIRDVYDDDHGARDRYISAVRAVAALVMP